MSHKTAAFQGGEAPTGFCVLCTQSYEVWDANILWAAEDFYLDI